MQVTKRCEDKGRGQYKKEKERPTQERLSEIESKTHKHKLKKNNGEM
jgi:hypothetical protein